MKKTVVSLIALLCTSGILWAGIENATALIGAVADSREVKIEGRYSMMIPDYLTPTDDLNSEASLQYQNITNEVYIIVIDESAEEFKKYYQDSASWEKGKSVLENYAREQLASIRSNMTNVTKEQRQPDLKTGCGNAIVYDMSGTSEDVDDAMGFKVAFIQGRLNLYFIMTWTFDKTFSTYSADMTGMIASFKELSGEIATVPPAGTIRVHGLYSVDIADGMIKDTSLNDEASLEYSDYANELYIIVIDEDTREFVKIYKEINDYEKDKTPLENYTRVQRKSLSESMTSIREMGDISSKKVNGLDTKTFTVRGSYAGVDEKIFYKARTVQGESNLYYIVTWTLDSYRTKNEPAMDKMLDSFKEL